MTFKEGDVVTLKSGGSRMTVLKVTGSEVACIWNDKGKVEHMSMPAHVLQMADAQPPITVEFSKPKPA